ISGVAVTYDETATVNDGTKVRFLQGSLPVTGRDPKLYMQHDSNQIVGKVVERVDTPQGMMFTAKISATRLGDEALTLANDGVIDAVSVGVTPTKFSYDEEGVMIVEAANWSELSLVSEGAFSGAVITEVAASAPDKVAEGIHETEPQTDVISEQEQTKDTDMTDKIETPVVEAAQATVDKLWAQPKQEFRMPSAGEYLAAMHIGGDTFAKVNQAFQSANRKNQSALQAAAGDVLTTDTPGLLPVPVLGTLFQDLNFVRPVVSALGARAMPNTPSKTFIRPTITTHTSAATQTEGSAASATTMVIASNVVTKTTVAGQVTLSVQDMDFTDPAAMNLILNDLAGEYLIATDNIAADNMVAGKTASGSTWTVTADNPTSLVNSLFDAAREIAEDSNYFPTHLFVSPDVWEKLGSQLDGSKRPLFPAVNGQNIISQNSLGTASGNLTYNSMNPLGLQLVVDNNFATGTMLVVYAPGFEVYEQQKGILSVEVPSTLSRTFSYYGYFATFVAKSSFIQSIVIA
ncbi:MAG: HK97 family phage prohead protease, partial [Weissella cibaria]